MNDVTGANVFWFCWFLVGFMCAFLSYKEEDGTRTIDDWFAYCLITLGGFMSLGAAIALHAIDKLINDICEALGWK